MKRIALLLVALLVAGCTAAPRVRIPQSSVSATPGATDLCLDSFFMSDLRSGWLLATDPGSSMVVLRTTDGGWGWTDVTPPELRTAQHPHSTVTATFRDGRTAWVGMATSDDSALATDGLITIARTTDGGAAWKYTTIPVLKAETHGLHLRFANTADGWLLVNSAPVRGLMFKAVYRTADGGATWELVSRNSWPSAKATPSPLPNEEYVTGIGARNGQEAWVTDMLRTDGGFPVYRTTDGGRTWTAQTLPEPGPFPVLNYINAYPPQFFGANGVDGVMLVEFRSTKSSVVAYRTHDGGTSWEPGAVLAGAPTDPLIPFWDFADSTHGFVLLDKALYATGDGGKSWTSIPAAQISGSQLQFLSPTAGLAMSPCGRPLQRTSDGGSSWTPIQVIPAR